MNKNSRGEAQSSKRMSLLSISLKVQLLLQKNQTPVILSAIPILKLPKQEPMTKQKKVNSTLSLKWMPLALNNSKLMPLAISLKGRAFQSKIAPSTQTALAGKAFLAANITEKIKHLSC